MSNQLTSYTKIAQPVSEVWQLASANARDKANDKLKIISPVITLLAHGTKLSQAFIALDIATKNHASIRRYIKAFDRGGVAALLPSYKGREIAQQEWHTLAIEIYNQTSKPSATSIAKRLRHHHGFSDASDYKVKHFLNKNIAKNSPKRVGKHYHQLNEKLYHDMDYSNIAAGQVYQGDGHTLDIYIADENTNKPVRYELTAWIDVKSRYIVGWYISKAESTISTLQSLSHAIIEQQHIPLMLHIDNGSGFINKMVDDDSMGFYARLGIDTRKAIPGNARAKGMIERWFRTLEMQLNALIGVGYCGKGQDPKSKSDWFNKAKNKPGSVPIVSLADYKNLLKDYIKQYHTTPHRGVGMNNQTPANVWSGIKRFAPKNIHDCFVWQQVQRVIQKGSIKLDGRLYQSSFLVAHNSKNVIVEYSLNDDMLVKVLELNGSFLATAELKAKPSYLSDSRIVEQEQKRLKGQEKRLDRKIQEKALESKAPIDNQIQTLQELGAMDKLENNTAELLDIDITQLSTD